jgi:hypothetical protein
MKIFIVLIALCLNSAFASETCKLTDKKGFHPDGTPYVRLLVNCTDSELQAELFKRYEQYRIGAFAFEKSAKKMIIQDILTEGYTKVGVNLYKLAH